MLIRFLFNNKIIIVKDPFQFVTGHDIILRREFFPE